MRVASKARPKATISGATQARQSPAKPAPRLTKEKKRLPWKAATVTQVGLEQRSRGSCVPSACYRSCNTGVHQRSVSPCLECRPVADLGSTHTAACEERCNIGRKRAYRGTSSE